MSLRFVKGISLLKKIACKVLQNCIICGAAARRFHPHAEAMFCTGCPARIHSRRSGMLRARHTGIAVSFRPEPRISRLIRAAAGTMCVRRR
jgi:hypothetical protein